METLIIIAVVVYVVALWYFLRPQTITVTVDNCHKVIGTVGRLVYIPENSGHYQNRKDYLGRPIQVTSSLGEILFLDNNQKFAIRYGFKIRR